MKPKGLKDLFSDNSHQQKKTPGNYNKNNNKQNYNSQPNQTGDPQKPNFRANPNRKEFTDSVSRPTTNQNTFQRPEFKPNQNKQGGEWETQPKSGNAQGSGYQKPEYKSNTNKTNPGLENQQGGQKPK